MSTYRICSYLLTLVVVATTANNPLEDAAYRHKLDTEVIIIGAGAAGIAAATRLAQNGIDVRIIEAEPRWGGRVNSVPFGDAIVDLGAEWCHGENLVYNMVKNSNVLVHTNYTDRLYVSDRADLGQEFLDEVMDLFKEVYNINDIARSAPEGVTFGEYFIKRYQQRVLAEYSNNVTKLTFALEALHTFKSQILTDIGAFTWFASAAASDFVESDGDYLMSWNGKGYRTFLYKLLEGFDIDKHITLNVEVKRVILNRGQNNVQVVLDNGKTLRASQVIFTPSLGVLKHKHKDLFVPKLSNKKVRAINAMGMDAVIKVMVHYNESWWTQTSDFAGFYFVWTFNDRESLFSRYSRPHGLNLSWLTNFLSALRVEQNQNVLSCWFTGEFVPQIERLSDEVIIEGITFAMKKFLGHMYNVTYPDQIIRAKWYSNPHFHGAYSYQTIASRKIMPSASEIIGEPIRNRVGVPKILFAGEATHPHYFSTVHGATESGFREADRILQWRSNDLVRLMQIQ